MIFMRALLTTTTGQCRVRAWPNTELVPRAISPLNPETIFMLLTHRISISLQSSDSKTESRFTSNLSKQARDFNHAHSLTSVQY